MNFSQTAQTNAMLGSSMYSGGSPGPLSPNYGSNDIWLEIEDTNTPQTVDLILHNPTVGLNWQLLSKTDLLDPNPWAFGEIQFADGTTNALHYRELEDTNPPIRFFRAVGAPWILGIQKNSDPAVEPIPPAGILGTNATFTLFFEQSATTNVTVYYSMSGVAVPGVDYSNWPGTMNGNIGSVVIPAGNPAQVTVQVQPLADPKIDFDEQVIFTPILSNSYVVDPGFPPVTITIRDNFGPTNIFQVVATNIPSAVGIDYNVPNQSLILPINYNDNSPATLGILHTNAVLANWSGISGVDVGSEVRIATVKTTTNGLTAGDLLFGNGNPGGIGWLSADGTTSNLNWIVITNEPNLIEGIYVDQTGIWSNDVLAVSGADAQFQSITNLNVWRVHLRTNAQLVATIPSLHLEGLLTLSNDSRYGPWAGKLLTADENQHAIFTVDPTGSVSNYFLGIDADAIRLIPTNQDLYCVHFRSFAPGRILKVPLQYFKDSVGDVLFEQAGETGPDPELFAVHWNGSSFSVHGIDLFTYFPNDGFFEKVSFAPVSMPPVQ